VSDLAIFVFGAFGEFIVGHNGWDDAHQGLNKSNGFNFVLSGLALRQGVLMNIA
jgi:hypothetical protein